MSRSCPADEPGKEQVTSRRCTQQRTCPEPLAGTTIQVLAEERLASCAHDHILSGTTPVWCRRNTICGTIPTIANQVQLAGNTRHAFTIPPPNSTESARPRVSAFTIAFFIPIETSAFDETAFRAMGTTVR